MNNTVQLKNFNNDWYQPGNNQLIRFIWFFVNVIVFNSYLFPFNSIKVFILRLFGAKVGNGVIIKPKVNIKYPWRLIIGDYSWVGEKVWIDNLADVVIEKNCCVSQGAMLLTGNHNYKKSNFDLVIGKITLKNGSWVGAQSIVCPGVTMEENSILSVGSVCSKNTAKDMVYRGNPAVQVAKRVIIE